MLSQSVDCRTPEERDSSSDKFIPKSRYSGINHYISDHEFVQDSHFDATEIKYSEEHFQ